MEVLYLSPVEDAEGPAALGSSRELRIANTTVTGAFDIVKLTLLFSIIVSAIPVDLIFVGCFVKVAI